MWKIDWRRGRDWSKRINLPELIQARSNSGLDEDVVMMVGKVIKFWIYFINRAISICWRIELLVTTLYLGFLCFVLSKIHEIQIEKEIIFCLLFRGDHLKLWCISFLVFMMYLHRHGLVHNALFKQTLYVMNLFLYH